MPRINKTKVGSEYRVRGKEGKIHGEFNDKKDAMKRAKKVAKKQGYNDRLDESLGMRRGKESTKKQSYKDRRDESRGMKKAVKAKIGRKK